MTDVQVIQPSELNTGEFRFDATTRQWFLVNPSVSENDRNVLAKGTDGGPYLGANHLKRYRMIYNSDTSYVSLYEYDIDQVFDISTAILIDSVALIRVDAAVDDVAISSGILTFTDAQTGQSLVFDTQSPIYSILAANSSSIAVRGDGKNTEFSLDLIVSTDSNNILKITAEGAMVSKEDLLTVMNSHLSETLGISHSPDYGQLTIKAGTTEKSLPTSRLLNRAGDVIGFIIST